jgi:hypothetical protein
MSIKQDQYTLIDDTGREAVVIKTKAGMGMYCYGRSAVVCDVHVMG